MYPTYNVLYTRNTLFNNNKNTFITLNFKMYVSYNFQENDIFTAFSKITF